jgi:DNA polymerase epsilon subunit 4
MAPSSTENTTETPKSTSKTVAERTPGTSMLPLARVKRVIKEDKDIALINADATYCITYATVNISIKKAHGID